MVMNGSVMTTKKERLANKEINKMKVTYEIENGKKVKVKTYADGTVFKYDENNNEIYYKGCDGYEMWGEYNANRHCIHFKDNYGEEEWRDYDSKGRMIYLKVNDGFEEWCEYAEEGHCIHYKDNRGNEWFAEDYEERKVC